MKILAFDTSGSTLNVGVFDSTTGLFFVHNHDTDQARTHSMKILPAISELMKRAVWDYKDLNRIVVTAGPGSFTGLRIGATVAKILASQLSCDLVAVSTLFAISNSIKLSDEQFKVPLINARNHNVFASVYDQQGKVVISEKHWVFSKLLKQLPKNSCFIFEKDTADEFKNEIRDNDFNFIEQESNRLIDPEVLAKLSLRLPIVNPDHFVPNYLRKTAAEMNWEAKHPEAKDEEYTKYVSEV
ncbi:tRNA (adenosine(37)-N6)-threonylcarbamoyltransferase complex dimerization subunit type 1 TsaB [Oenococcus sp. UCMA 16435]|nr:tRNA (adenosine(37)-N6)-threonylcarbamoyltransferase complex dimerization subunit type 1 TsaB [Oenococcus sp. UCMA 16435]MDI4583509.1 tRNA (adenosine(37)-N6)-threonylcarbamoyltransferase complex dimerization subunit type 1 TsaB [Oenococcus sp. UCMA 14587]MDN6967704.1 tRNA (adenosine(37)-N6)-threonylcarbamoyltransferase complex dimerization subunit type 1 TsaB [Oenococcus sp. UCMA 17063]